MRERYDPENPTWWLRNMQAGIRKKFLPHPGPRFHWAVATGTEPGGSRNLIIPVIIPPLYPTRNDAIDAKTDLGKQSEVVEILPDVQYRHKSQPKNTFFTHGEDDGYSHP